MRKRQAERVRRRLTTRTHSVSNRAKYRDQSTSRIGKIVKKTDVLTCACWRDADAAPPERRDSAPNSSEYQFFRGGRRSAVDHDRIAHQVGPSLKSHSQTLCDPDRGRVLGMDHADDVRLLELREGHIEGGTRGLGGIAHAPRTTAAASRRPPGPASRRAASSRPGRPARRAPSPRPPRDRSRGAASARVRWPCSARPRTGSSSPRRDTSSPRDRRTSPRKPSRSDSRNMRRMSRSVSSRSIDMMHPPP